MKNNRALAPWIKRFLLEYLPTDRNFARNTQHSYRDALRLLLIFTSATLHKKPDELLVADIRRRSGERVPVSHRGQTEVLGIDP